MQIKICDECKKTCMPLLSKSRPKSSEWYCEKCHKSYPLSTEEFAVLNQRVTGSLTTDTQ